MWDSGRDYHPAGREVSREALQHKSSPRIVVGKKPLTGESSCEAGHMTCTRPQAERQILLATRASSTHDPTRTPVLRDGSAGHRAEHNLYVPIRKKVRDGLATATVHGVPCLR